jgi:hypothetical protein
MDLQSIISSLNNYKFSIESSNNQQVIKLLDNQYVISIHINEENSYFELPLIDLKYNIPTPLLISLLTLRPSNATLSLNLEDERIKIVAISHFNYIDIEKINKKCKQVIEEFNKHLSIILDCSSIIQNFSLIKYEQSQQDESVLSEELKEYL